MREIRFRAWDKHNKKMSNVSMFLLSTDEIDTDDNMGEPKMSYHYEIMQYTGLKDKNGREIYEGDIIEFTMSDEKRVCVVEYRNGAFIVESDGFFGIGEFDLSGIGWAVDEMDASVVIGNIHDNPELINKPQHGAIR